MFERALLVTLGLLAVAGCGLNERTLAGDAATLLGRCGVEPSFVNVTMPDRSRTGLVEISIDADGVDAVVGRLALREGGEGVPAPELLSWRKQGLELFDHPLLRMHEGVETYRSTRRPETLRLPGGSSFEYLLLYWHEASSTALMQLSYAHG